MADTKLAHNHKDLEQLRKECKEKYNDLEVIEYKHEIIGKQIRKYVLVSNGKHGWLLYAGVYDITFNEGCKIPNNRVAFIKQRSSLYRNGG